MGGVKRSNHRQLRSNEEQPQSGKEQCSTRDHENRPDSSGPPGREAIRAIYPGVSPWAIFVRSLRELECVGEWMFMARGRQFSGQILRFAQDDKLMGVRRGRITADS